MQVRNIYVKNHKNPFLNLITASVNVIYLLKHCFHDLNTIEHGRKYVNNIEHQIKIWNIIMMHEYTWLTCFN